MGIRTAKWLALGLSVLLFCILYFGFSNHDKSKKSTQDRQRALTTEATGPEILMKEAKASLSPDSLTLIGRLEHASEEGTPDTTSRLESLKRLSGLWYRKDRYGLAGYYAQQVAEIQKDAASWSIAGTTYGMGAKHAATDKEKSFCTGRAIKAFEHAISLEPEVIAHQLNLAVIYTDAPPQDNPMKGILMLQDLNKKDPQNTSVLNVLGQLAIKTGQWERAITRLESSKEIDPMNKQTYCLLSMAYDGAGQAEKAAEAAQKCQ